MLYVKPIDFFSQYNMVCIFDEVMGLYDVELIELVLDLIVYNQLQLT